MTLIKASILGEVAFHIFKRGDEVIHELCTLEEYVALGQPNPLNPTKDGWVWDGSFKDYLLDTPSGDLEDGYYVEQPNNPEQLIIKESGVKRAWVKKQEVLNKI